MSLSENLEVVLDAAAICEICGICEGSSTTTYQSPGAGLSSPLEGKYNTDEITLSCEQISGNSGITTNGIVS